MAMAGVASRIICTHASRIVSTQPGQFDPNFSIIVSVPDYSAISTPAIFQDDAVFRSAGKGVTLGNRLSARPVRTIVTCRCGRGNERISAGGPVVSAWQARERRREADDCPDMCGIPTGPLADATRYVEQEPSPDDGLFPGIRIVGNAPR